jgi:ABC-2 type transport system ATP-binding protein
MTRTDEKVVEARDLTKTFGTIRALESLDLSISRGEVFGFLGSNGAGKTTTIRLLLGLTPADSGSALVLGLDPRIDSRAIRRRSGVLLEYSGAYDRLTALENLRFVGGVYGMTRDDVEARGKQLLTEFELWDRRNDLVGTWSRGMRQKLGLVRAILHRPELVFLDEPTAGLDPVATVSVREMIGRITSDSGATVFLTTHNLAEAERLCDRVAIIRAGRVLRVGKISELDASGARGTRRLRVSGDGFTESVVSNVKAVAGGNVIATDTELAVELLGGSDPSSVVTAIVTAGGRVRSVKEEGATLENIYLQLMEGERGK